MSCIFLDRSLVDSFVEWFEIVVLSTYQYSGKFVAGVIFKVVDGVADVFCDVGGRVNGCGTSVGSGVGC